MDYKKLQRLYGKPHPVNPWHGKNQKAALYAVIGLILVCAAIGVNTVIKFIPKKRKSGSKDK